MNIIEKNITPDKGDWGIITSPSLKVNNKEMKPRSWVCDDFYEDPDMVREYALSQSYWADGHGGVGWRTRKQYIFDGVREKIESIMGMEITNWAETYSICGVFQAGFAGSDGIPPQVFHADSQKWAAMVFLTPDAPPSTGTKIVRNKITKKYDTEAVDNITEIFTNQETFCDPTPYEDVDTFGNVYNRMVIFDGHCAHTSMGYFGSNFGNGRLWQMFFFDAKQK